MKIAIDIQQIIYGTGVSNYTKELVKGLLKIDQENTYILYGSSLRAYFKLKEFRTEIENAPNVKFKIIPLPASITTFLFNTLRIFPIEKFLGESVDILHSSDWSQPKVESQLTKKITTVHDMIPYLFETSVHPKIVKTHKKRLGLVKNEVDLILADSYATKEDIMKFLEIPASKIKVVYLAPSKEFKNEDPDKVNAVLEKFKIKKPYVLSVATQEPRKNIQKLLDAFEELQKRRPDLTLVLAGKHGYGPGIRAGENVISTGYVSDEDLISLYSGCRVFVYPSLYEGFGLPILEAMACGAPVVTSNNSSIVEIAKEAAILVDPRSLTQLTRAIEMVLDLNMENYQKMVRASLNRAAEFTWERTARETLDAYKQLVPVSHTKQLEDLLTEDVDKNVDENVERAQEKEVEAIEEDKIEEVVPEPKLDADEKQDIDDNVIRES